MIDNFSKLARSDLHEVFQFNYTLSLAHAALISDAVSNEPSNECELCSEICKTLEFSPSSVDGAGHYQSGSKTRIKNQKY